MKKIAAIPKITSISLQTIGGRGTVIWLFLFWSERTIPQSGVEQSYG